MFKPLLYCIYYKIKFGSSATIKFFPLVGMFYYSMKSEDLHNNSWTWVRKIKEENPKIKMILSNFGDSFTFIPIGHEFNKDALLHNALNS